MMKKPIKEAFIVGSIGIAFIVAALTLLTSCGGVYKIEIPDVQISVTHRISTSEFLDVFSAQCRRELGPNATPQQITECANGKLAEFFTDLANAVNNQT